MVGDLHDKRESDALIDDALDANNFTGTIAATIGWAIIFLATTGCAVAVMASLRYIEESDEMWFTIGFVMSAWLMLVAFALVLVVGARVLASLSLMIALEADD